MASSFNSSFKQLLNSVPPFLRNRYALVLCLFLLWMLLFDTHDFITQYKLYKTQRELEEKKEFYTTHIEEVKNDRKDLFTNEKTIEKFAREHYYMKKSDEEVFVIER